MTGSIMFSSAPSLQQALAIYDPQPEGNQSRSEACEMVMRETVAKKLRRRNRRAGKEHKLSASASSNDTISI